MFLGAYLRPPYPKGAKAVVFSGRSNVGKSSLINHLTGVKNLAKTSTTPGKTQTINFFSIKSNLHFVDLPGYGFAKVSKSKQALWGKNIDDFLASADNLALIVQLLDIRHPPSEEDLQMIEWCCESGINTVFVLTKLDKIPPTKQSPTINEFTKLLNQYIENPIIVPYTIKDSQYKKRLSTLIEEALHQ